MFIPIFEVYRLAYMVCPFYWLSFMVTYVLLWFGIFNYKFIFLSILFLEVFEAHAEGGLFQRGFAFDSARYLGHYQHFRIKWGPFYLKVLFKFSQPTKLSYIWAAHFWENKLMQRVLMQRILKEDFGPLPLGITLKNFIAASLGWDCLISSAAW